jgi:hypothetical protein
LVELGKDSENELEEAAAGGFTRPVDREVVLRVAIAVAP